MANLSEINLFLQDKILQLLNCLNKSNSDCFYELKLIIIFNIYLLDGLISVRACAFSENAIRRWEGSTITIHFNYSQKGSPKLVSGTRNPLVYPTNRLTLSESWVWYGAKTDLTSGSSMRVSLERWWSKRASSEKGEISGPVDGISIKMCYCKLCCLRYADSSNSLTHESLKAFCHSNFSLLKLNLRSTAKVDWLELWMKVQQRSLSKKLLNVRMVEGCGG